MVAGLEQRPTEDKGSLWALRNQGQQEGPIGEMAQWLPALGAEGICSSVKLEDT
jgi:hypothetical protein